MIGVCLALWGFLFGGIDTGWTFYTPFSTAYSNTHVVDGGPRDLRRRVLLDLHRPELHCHHPPHARARD